MKKCKPILATILALLLLLAACGRNFTEPTGTEATAATTRPPLGGSDWDQATRPEPTYPDQYTTEIKIKAQYLPEIVENPDNLPVLKWLCLTQDFDGIGYNRVWSEAAAEEINQMLADRKMPFRVQFVIYTSDYRLIPLDWLARSEIQEDLKTADLILHNFPMAEVEAYLEPLTQYVTGDAEPSLKNAVPHDASWLKTTKNGEIYGISYNNNMPTSAGWRVDPKLLSTCGLTEEDFQKEFWEMDEVLAKIYNNNGNKAFLYVPPDGLDGALNVHAGISAWTYYPSSVMDYMADYFISVGSVFAVDFSKEKPTVINTFDTVVGRKIQAALARYHEAGYLIRDNTADCPMMMGSVYGHRSYIDYNGRLAIPVTAPIYDCTWAYLYRSNSVMAASKHKDKAISLLSLIADDEEFRDHLLFGKEGRDYTVDTDGNYQLAKQEDGSTYYMAFLSPWGEFNDLKCVSGYGWVPVVGTRNDVVYEGLTELQSYREMWDNAGTSYYSVALDFTGLEKELEEVRIWAKYYAGRFTKLSEENYNQMVADINAAGGTKIMAELQKQLDEWVKENPEKAAANRQFG